MSEKWKIFVLERLLLLLHISCLRAEHTSPDNLPQRAALLYAMSNVNFDMDIYNFERVQVCDLIQVSPKATLPKQKIPESCDDDVDLTNISKFIQHFRDQGSAHENALWTQREQHALQFMCKHFRLSICTRQCNILRIAKHTCELDTLS